MHTTYLTPKTDDGEYWVVLHNSDWSGEVQLKRILAEPIRGSQHCEVAPVEEFTLPGHLFLTISQEMLYSTSTGLVEALCQALHLPLPLPPIDFEALGVKPGREDLPEYLHEPGARCDSCIMEGRNSEAFAPPRFGESCCSCNHRCDGDENCCSGIEGWEIKMEKYKNALHEKFLDWASKNMDIVTQFFKFADRAWDLGRHPIGAKLIVERIRWETTIEGGKDFKVNNSYTTYLARLYVQAKPQRKGLFRFRGDSE